MKPSHILSTGILLAFSVLGAQSANAGSFNFSGMFAHDDNYQFFTFTIASAAIVTLETTSYVSGDSNSGFLPYLHVWDSSGMDLSGVEPTDGNAIYPVNLGAAGTYYVGLTVANNKATGDFPGGSSTPTPTVFDHNGMGNFTGDVTNGFGCGSGPFWTPACVQHTGAWALGITGADSASLYPANAVPEPATLALGLAGAAAFAPYARRWRLSVSA